MTGRDFACSFFSNIEAKISKNINREVIQQGFLFLKPLLSLSFTEG